MSEFFGQVLEGGNGQERGRRMDSRCECQRRSRVQTHSHMTSRMLRCTDRALIYRLLARHQHTTFAGVDELAGPEREDRGGAHASDMTIAVSRPDRLGAVL